MGKGKGNGNERQGMGLEESLTTPNGSLGANEPSDLKISENSDIPPVPAPKPRISPTGTTQTAGQLRLISSRPKNFEGQPLPQKPCVECKRSFFYSEPFHYTPKGPVHGKGEYGEFGTCEITKAPPKKTCCLECRREIRANEVVHEVEGGLVHGPGNFNERDTCTVAKHMIESASANSSSSSSSSTSSPTKTWVHPDKPDNADELERPEGYCIECNQSFIKSDAFHWTEDGPIHGWGKFNQKKTCKLQRVSPPAKCLECKQTIWSNEPKHKVKGGVIHGKGKYEQTGTCLYAHRAKIEVLLLSVAEGYIEGEYDRETVEKAIDKVRELEEAMDKRLEGGENFDMHGKPKRELSEKEKKELDEFLDFLFSRDLAETIEKLSYSKNGKDKKAYKRYKKLFKKYSIDKLDTMGELIEAVFDEELGSFQVNEITEEGPEDEQETPETQERKRKDQVKAKLESATSSKLIAASATTKICFACNGLIEAHEIFHDTPEGLIHGAGGLEDLDTCPKA